MNIKKINGEQVKEFLFQHGEKVALGTCAFLGLALAVLGVLRAWESGVDPASKLPWDKALDAKIKDVRAKMVSVQIPPDEKIEITDWGQRGSKYGESQYLPTEDIATDKRENPVILPIGSKDFQMEIVHGLVVKHEYAVAAKELNTLLKDNAAGVKTLPPLVQVAEPVRMVVCTARYPMKALVEKFRTALRYKTQNDMRGKDGKDIEDLPKPLGFNVVRYEIQPDGKRISTDIVLQDGNKLIVSEALEKLLHDAIYDEDAAAALEPYAFGGMLMPIPKLAPGSAKYLDIKLGLNISLEGEKLSIDMKPKPKEKPPGGDVVIVGPKKNPPKIKVDKDKEKEDPNDYKIKAIDRDELDQVKPSLAKRLYDANGFNIYHVLGILPPKDDDKKNPPVAPGNQGADESKYFFAWDVAERQPAKVKKGKGVAAPPPGTTEWNCLFDAVVRFIDPDVQPGKTYQYAVQVRFKNPNFGKKKEVQFEKLAEPAELLLTENTWAYTEPITIPYEYFIYAVDQPVLDGLGGDKRGPFMDPKTARDHTTFQVHQWIKSKPDEDLKGEYVIGDWVVAERLDVRKGEKIGLRSIVQVPVWRKLRDGFVVPKPVTVSDPRFFKRPISGIKVDLLPPGPGDTESSPPTLVDFSGGRRKIFTKDEEEAATDVLLMSADGQLRVFNSREDADDRDRKARLERARKRLIDVSGSDGR